MSASKKEFKNTNIKYIEEKRKIVDEIVRLEKRLKWIEERRKFDRVSVDIIDKYDYRPLLKCFETEGICEFINVDNIMKSDSSDQQSERCAMMSAKLNAKFPTTKFTCKGNGDIVAEIKK